MLEGRLDNALAALDVLARADSTAFATGRADAAFSFSREGQIYYAVPFTGNKRGFTRVEDNVYRVWASSPADAIKRAQAALSTTWNVKSTGNPTEDKNNGRSDAASDTLTLWRYDKITGYWKSERQVTAETQDAWLRQFTTDAPNETFRVAKNRPNGRP